MKCSRTETVPPPGIARSGSIKPGYWTAHGRYVAPWARHSAFALSLFGASAFPTWAAVYTQDFNRQSVGSAVSVSGVDRGVAYSHGAVVRTINANRYLRQDDCTSLFLRFHEDSRVSKVTFVAVNRHQRSYRATAYSGDRLVDQYRFTGPSQSGAITLRNRVALQSNNELTPITRVELEAPEQCFDQAGLDDLTIESGRELIPMMRVEINNATMVPLHQWWSRASQDNRLSSARSWHGSDGRSREGYNWVGVVGYLFSPKGAQPPGTVPLYTWYSPSRSDYKTIADPAWVPGASDRPRRQSYIESRLEGYLFDASRPPPAGTFPLQMHYSRARAEFDTTTRYSMLGRRGRLTNGYENRGTQGYVIAPDAEHAQPGTIWGFGMGKVRYKSDRNAIMSGGHRVVMVRQDYGNVPSQYTDEQAAALIDGPGPNGRNINGLFREMSEGRFEFKLEGVFGPFRMMDNPNTAANETNYNCNRNVTQSTLDGLSRDMTLAEYARSACPGYVSRSWGQINRWTLSSALRQLDRDFDFARYDFNGDGTIRNDELSVFILSASLSPMPDAERRRRFPGVVRGYGGIVRGPDGYGGCIPVDGVRFCAKIGLFDDGAALDTIGHELFHLTDNSVSGNDIYGSGSSFLSLMSVGDPAVTDIYHLDAWHKMRLGWNRPNIRPISEWVAPSSRKLGWGGEDSVLFADPAKGYREYFMAEYRGNDTYDRVPPNNTKGVHVWYARMRDRRGGDGRVENINPAQITLEEGPLCGDPGRNWREDPAKVGHLLWSIGFQVTDACVTQIRGGHWLPLRREIGWREPLYYPATATLGAVVPSGTPSGLQLHAGPLTPDRKSIDLEWSTSDLPFLPRLDAIEISPVMSSKLKLSGNFGLRRAGSTEERRVLLTMEGAVGSATEIALEILRWRADEIDAKLPATLQPGRYKVAVQNTSVDQAGNYLQMLVR